jgi:hypothetical protein
MAYHRTGQYYRADRRPVPANEVIRPEFCPRCSQVLQQEPAFAYCKYGCGRVFIVDRRLLGMQYRYELVSGLQRRRGDE